MVISQHRRDVGDVLPPQWEISNISFPLFHISRPSVWQSILHFGSNLKTSPPWKEKSVQYNFALYFAGPVASFHVQKHHSPIYFYISSQQACIN